MVKHTGYGVVGCGYFGTAIAHELATLPDARVVTVHSRSQTSARRVAAAVGGTVSATLADLVAHPEVEAVIVATPNHLHREPVVQAAQRGKHVFCEKPFALSLADTDAMIQTCQAAGVTLMVGHILHFHPGIRQVADLLQTGAIGRPLVAHAERTGWEPPRERVSWKKMQTQSGGHLFHHIHEIDLLLWLLGPVVEVYAVGGNLAHQGPGYGDEDDVLLLTLRFASGAVGTMHYGSAFRQGAHRVLLNGAEGALLIDHQTGIIEQSHADRTTTRQPLFDNPASQASLERLFAQTDGGTVYGAPDDATPAYLREMLAAELACFHRVINGAPIAPEHTRLFDGSAARAAIAVASAALAALRTGQPVRLD